MIFSRFSYKVELAPKEAPEGLELATFAGKVHLALLNVRSASR